MLGQRAMELLLDRNAIHIGIMSRMQRVQGIAVDLQVPTGWIRAHPKGDRDKRADPEQEERSSLTCCERTDQSKTSCRAHGNSIVLDSRLKTICSVCLMRTK